MRRNAQRRASRAPSLCSSSAEDADSVSWDGSADIDASRASPHDAGSSSSCEWYAPPRTALAHICIAFERDVAKTCRRSKTSFLRPADGPVEAFTGRDAVSFLADNGYANSRGEALKIGRAMACEFALFQHLSRDFDLEDEKHLLYTFTPRSRRVMNPPPESCSAVTLTAIVDAFEEGVIAGTNIYRNKTHKHTFLGTDAVSFLVSAHLSKTRQDAVRIGQLIMEKHGAFRPVTRHHAFKDKPLPYRFVPQKLRLPRCLPAAAEAIEETAQRFMDAVGPGHAFSGGAAVDALVGRGIAATRSEAIALGDKLASDLQLFRGVLDRERPFLDRRDIFYRYNAECDASPCLHWLDDSVGCAPSHAQDGAERWAPSFDSDRKPSSFTEHTVENEEDCRATKEDCLLIRKCAGRGMAFHISEDSSGQEYLVGFDVTSEEGTSAVAEVPAALTEPRARARCFDKFGFLVDGAASATSHDGTDSVETIEQEWSSEEWRALLDSCATQRGAPARSGAAPLPHPVRAHAKRMMRTGAPDSLRRQAWTAITGVETLVRERAGDYRSCVEAATLYMEDERNTFEGGQSLRGVLKVVERDLHRTFPQHCFFSSTEVETLSSDSTEHCIPDGLASLRRVLYAYSIYDNEVGYCQGMNFLAAMFLTLQLSEEESFWLLVAVMNDAPYVMRELFAEDMAGVHETLYVADRLVQAFLPKLSKHLVQEGVDISMFATQWIMTVFTSTFPFDLVARVWDSFIVEGRKVLFRVLLSLLEFAQRDILHLDLEHILAYLRDLLPSKIHGPSIVKASLTIPLRKRHIQKYTNEWRVGKIHKRRRRSFFQESVEAGIAIFPGKSTKHTDRGSEKHTARKQWATKRLTL